MIIRSEDFLFDSNTIAYAAISETSCDIIMNKLEIGSVHVSGRNAKELSESLEEVGFIKLYYYLPHTKINLYVNKDCIVGITKNDRCIKLYVQIDDGTEEVSVDMKEEEIDDKFLILQELLIENRRKGYLKWF